MIHRMLVTLRRGAIAIVRLEVMMMMTRLVMKIYMALKITRQCKVWLDVESQRLALKVLHK